MVIRVGDAIVFGFVVMTRVVIVPLPPDADLARE